MIRLLLLLVGCATLNSAAARHKKEFGASDYIAALKKVTDVMLNDVTSPVAAGRYYAYITLTANEIQAATNPAASYSFAGRLHGFSGVDVSGLPVVQSEASLATILAVLKTGEKLLPSGYLLQSVADSILTIAVQRGVPKAQIDASKMLVDGVLDQMLRYIRLDGFNKLSALPRYTPISGDDWWQPTPPAFMAPVEPHWGTIRTFVLDSSAQFIPTPPAPYDTTQTSAFYTQMMEVYNVAKKADPGEQLIAMFWDCNPFAVQQIGHVQFGIKKISPGGHWIGITGIACKRKKCTLAQTALAHALVGITLCDAFIACWEEKYRSNRIRPETAICRLIDPLWHPLLQTPPFPEYVSGHSVASSAAAIVLTRLFGENFAFTDDTEVEFELPKRRFSSFAQAASEASVSRLYGGIHFRDGIDQGIWLGNQVGECAAGRLHEGIAVFAKKK